MRIIGVNGGNGVILYPMKRYLVENYEPRALFKTKDNVQWKLNFGDIPLYTKFLDFYDRHDPRNDFDIDVIVGAPDCGHSSVLAYSRAKQLSDPLKNESLDLYLRSVKIIKPKVFMMENLPKLLDMVNKDIFQETFPEYELIYLTNSVSAWGNSQKTRVRLVIIGLKLSSFGKNISQARDYFTNVYKINELKTSGELLKGLIKEDISIGHVRENINDIITLYAGFKTSLYDIKKFWRANPDLKRWPVYDRKFTTAPGVYRNLYDDYPATARKANRQFNHRGLQMSPRELASIQGVPRKFGIFMDSSELTYWINKGRTTVTKTPPYEIGKWFYKQLKKVQPLWK